MLGFDVTVSKESDAVEDEEENGREIFKGEEGDQWKFQGKFQVKKQVKNDSKRNTKKKSDRKRKIQVEKSSEKRKHK